MESFNEYLLLSRRKGSHAGCQTYPHGSSADRQKTSAADPSSFHPSKKLTFELLQPKLDDLLDLCDTWCRRPSEGGSQISLDRFQSLLSACMIGSLLVSQFFDLNMPQASTVQSKIIVLVEKSLNVAMDSIEPFVFVESALRTLRSCMPGLQTSDLTCLHSQHPTLLSVIAAAARVLIERQSVSTFGSASDFMEIDDDLNSQSSGAASMTILTPLPRLNVQLCASSRAFHIETKKRLNLIRRLHDNPSQIGLLPAEWIADLLNTTDDELLHCRALLLEISTTDLVVGIDNALSIIQRLGEVISLAEYQCCEVAVTTCIDVVDGLHNLWLTDNSDLADSVGDLYNYFVKVCLPSNLFSAKAQVSTARLIFTLLVARPSYGSDLGLDSCRTSLLNILASGPMQVKCFVAEKIADVFDLFVLMLHDEIFVDVLASLPANSDDTSGIAFRLLALSRLACRWPTLLRRCIYHIFETPGKVARSIEYAKRCLADISESLSLRSIKELFQLFSRQLLYTWMEHDAIEDIPFTIFGFEDLTDLLQSAQAEAAALAIMRIQKPAIATLASSLSTTVRSLITNNFPEILSYSMAFGDAHGSLENGKGEDFIREVLGHKAMVEAIRINFVDIAASLLDLVDQEDHFEKVLRKHESLSYAADNLETIKGFSHSANRLPSNQQPMFRAKFIIHDIFRLCQIVDMGYQDLWTPAVTISIIRRLFNTVHPALGSLHACSVVRKARLVVCLAGPAALQSYCVEMLLNSAQSYIVDPVCADDALGLSQYILSGGADYLAERPSFVAGYALSTLASLRVFLESSQSNTTQESAFKATMERAQKFHEWFSRYLAEYTSLMFHSDSQATLFRSITHSAAHIRSSGNAQKGTSESKLLLDILCDGLFGHRLLNESSRELALKLLCSDFSIPEAIADDIIDTDKASVEQSSRIWKSCAAHNMSNTYLAWAGRVVGRSFAASGEIPSGVLKESRLGFNGETGKDLNGSEFELLSLVQYLAADQNSRIAGLAEAALRIVVSKATELEDEPLVAACQKTLSESLFSASQWGHFHFHLQSGPKSRMKPHTRSGWDCAIDAPGWLHAVSASLASCVPDSILLSVLPPILAEVPDFAEKAFPFILHLVLGFQLEQQQETVKQQVSSSLKEWLQCMTPGATQNLKLMVDSILYLRTREYPKETSMADRLYWLDIDFATAAQTAARCGMHRTALLFAELAVSDSGRSHRRSAVHLERGLDETLLTIFENIDDPDAYYGLSEEASLSRVLSRVEHENEGSSSLAFRGAKYDAHLRLRAKEAVDDGQALIKALGTLGLSGLSHSLLQTQQHSDTDNALINSTYNTARRLEMWTLPAPANSSHHDVVLYQVFQCIQSSADTSAVRSAIYEALGSIMRNITISSLNATNIRSRLTVLAALTELDDMLSMSDASEIGNIFGKFTERSGWMRSGS